MGRWWAWGAIVAVMSAAAGCVGPATRMEIEHRPDDGTVSGYANHRGDYALWKVRSEGNEHQLARFAVKNGDVLGFDTTGSALVAVAGADRYPLERGWYRWYRIVPSGEVAAELSLRIALFPFMLAGTPGM